MKKANFIVKEKSIYSLDFEDFYFNSNEGIKESRFVYTEAFEFEKEQSIIAELGFGIGLNFFLTLKRFLQNKQKGQRLFYISFENFYISKENLLDIYKKLDFYEEFKELIDRFLKFYPPCKDGIYRFYFNDCYLDLVFGDAKENLSKLNFKSNIWYLDGFSPAKNSDMFDEELISFVAKNSALNAKILTFSAASSLRKILIKYDFEVLKVKGFYKREMLRATFKGKDEEESIDGFFKYKFLERKVKKVAIVGAGIAGACLAYELSLRNFEVDVFEKEEEVALGASGNINGILSSLILKPNVLLGEFSQYAFIEASRFYQQNLDIFAQGVYEIAHNDLMKERFATQMDNVLFDIENDKAFLKDGMCVEPRNLVKKLLEKSKAKIFLSHDYKNFVYDDFKFKLFFENQTPKSDYDVLIYAQGFEISKFLTYKFMKLSSVRGQCTHLKPFLDNKHAISSKGYICPINQRLNLQLIGASYDRLNKNANISEEDNVQNIANISEFLNDENLKIINAKVGFRSYSSDRFCIVGQAYDEEYFLQNYKALLWHKNKKQKIPPPYIPLYFSAAHGSRGLASSVIAARLIASLICNEPNFFNDFLHSIHPARFLIRRLKKGLF